MRFRTVDFTYGDDYQSVRSRCFQHRLAHRFMGFYLRIIAAYNRYDIKIQNKVISEMAYT